MKKILTFVAACMSAVAMMAAPAAAPTAPTLPANQVKAVYSATYSADCDFGEWGSGTAYTQETYGKKFVTTNLGYFGLCFEGSKALNCAQMEGLRLAVYSDAAMSLRVVPIHGGAEVGVTKNITAGEWNYIDIALSEFTGVTNWTNVYQIKIDNAASQTFWVNDVYFYRATAPDTDTEAPTAFAATFVSANYVSAKINVVATDNSGAVTFVVKNGEAVLATESAVSATAKDIVVKGLNPGTTYNLSVIAKDEAGNEAAPITVDATTPAAPELAAAPTAAAEDVLSIYSAHYESGVSISELCQNWWNGPEYGEIIVGEDKALFYHSNMGGCFGIAFAPVDVTAYATCEMDVYATTAGHALIDLIGVTTNESTKTYTDLAAGWNHVVLNIKGNTKTNCEQVGFYEYASCGEFLLQNVILVKEQATGLHNVEAVKAVKVIENGKVVIIKNGVRYNALGAQL